MVADQRRAATAAATRAAFAIIMLATGPEGIIAHRVGDFVFTYHGAAFDGRDARLWTFVMLPDPDQNPAPGPDEVVLISSGESAGDIRQITCRHPVQKTVVNDRNAVHEAPVGI